MVEMFHCCSWSDSRLHGHRNYYFVSWLFNRRLLGANFQYCIASTPTAELDSPLSNPLFSTISALTNMNPYVAGGWDNPENPNSMNAPAFQTPAFRQPSVFGALPSLGIAASVGSLKFRFRSHIPDIRNSTLCAPNGSDYLEIVTSQHMTYFRKKDQTVMATIDWSGQPRVSISGLIENFEIRRWLPCQPDG